MSKLMLPVVAEVVSDFGLALFLVLDRHTTVIVNCTAQYCDFHME